MMRNCNLELRLVTPSAISNSSMDFYNHEKQQLTVFYNGQIAVSDVTQLQARAILSLARQEMEEKSSYSPRSDPLSPMVNAMPTLYSPITSGLSMKRSLQRFLQKRKTRAQATSPYPIFRH